MPEYLAPGVYVEEIDTGSKPIEGVSTSTAGMIGVAERGPLDVPVLITGTGEYARWFGGLLDVEEFRDPNDPARSHAYLPHAVDGFFRNGGKRVYVARVAPAAATRAARVMFDRGAGTGGTVLLRTARQGTGSVAAPPGLQVLDPAGLAANDWVRIGDGSRAEYLQIDSTGAGRQVAVNRPLAQAHAAGAAVLSYAPLALAAFAGPHTLVNPVAAGGGTIRVSSPQNLATLPIPCLVRFDQPGVTAFSRVTAVNPVGGGQFDLSLVPAPDSAYAAGFAVAFLGIPGSGGQPGVPTSRTLDSDAGAGDLVVFASAAGGVPGTVVELEPAVAALHEIRRIGALGRFDLAQPAYDDYPALSTVEHVSLADDAGADPKPAQLTADAAAGARLVSLDSRGRVDVGSVLRIGASPDDEYLTVAAIPGERGAGLDPGPVILAAPLAKTHLGGAAARLQSPPAPAAPANQTVRLFLAAGAGTTGLSVNDAQNYTANAFVRVTVPGGPAFYHRLAANPALYSPGLVTLKAPLLRTHAIGAPLVERAPLFDVQALDVGGWGDRLLISVEDEAPGLVSRAELTAINPPQQLTLTTLTGVEAGSVLELLDPVTGAAVGTRLKVRRIDRSGNNLVVLDTGAALTAVHIAAFNAAAMAGRRLGVRSREFRLTARLKRRPDPAVPSRNDQILDSESFRYLSMDHRHSRYFQTVIGLIGGPPRLADRRPEGESWYIRVRDRATPLGSEALRLGPEALVDVLPSGQLQAARHALSGGSDAIGTITDDVYLGLDNADPAQRTGIHALKNIDQISIVAVPGQTTPAIQQALIDHCEELRYRFAVLDSGGPPRDSLTDVQTQRQQFDTKYAALYYPWLTVPDPLPDNLASIAQLPIPPSGHVIGIYARVDIERGVHKAPANEVVRGITGLRRSLNKGEHDILNPSPVNINVIRDFRPDNRGIRVWGARVITSDTDYKYVPVRRLLIFLEKSIEQGLQWVVFEPNAEPLWARVRRAISNFLTVVWRNGALEGTKPEEAFFVKCDRTTMTQTDIDNGRLICVIGVAPVKPAEFVIIRIGLFTAHADD